MPDEEQDERPGRRAGTAGQARAGREDGSAKARPRRDVPAPGRHGAAPEPTSGRPGPGQRQEATATRAGFDDRNGVFFAAAKMTRMPMLVTDPRQPDNPIVFANRAFLDLTGYAEEEVLGRNCRFLQGALTDRATIRRISEALAERRPIAVELLNYRKDGRPFWNALFIGPIFGPDGELTHFFSSQYDATGHHETEDALRQAQRMEAIGHLAAGLAHEFNNALHVVLGNLGRAETRLPGEADEVRRALNRAKQAGRHAAVLTRQLVAFARRSRLQPRRLMLNSVLAEFGETLAGTLAGGADLDLRYDLDPRLPPCIADRTEVEASLLHLLANARDAMPDGGRITVRTGTVDLDEAAVLAGGDGLRPGRYLVLAVEDDGPGMAPEVLTRSVEPFFTTRPGKGTGLGLAAVHGFVRQSGGRLEIASAPGRGTTVRLLFPMAPAEGDASPPPSKAEAVRIVRDGTAAVLAVDDDASVLDLAVHHLTSLGYRVLAARSGEEALEVLKGPEGARVDLLFTDILMPGGMNGLVLAEHARKLRPGLRVLYATGYSDHLVADAPPADGADALAKPYRQTDLAARVRVALDRPAGSPGHAPSHDGRDSHGGA